ncbi:hypothetical protein SAY87_008519 [Trapa incisa]|uniref:Auxin-responsive protein n=2 Tax=Trapa TaxID=22665 RepID=A0AAN7RHB9_TRANT|nr:hypothetical protein SAY87_008519 [Trapa incisa]KAK4798346.1 hypothetical protein SAY86_030672 [Trapa natans]
MDALCAPADKSIIDLEATELRLGLPGTSSSSSEKLQIFVGRSNKRPLGESSMEGSSNSRSSSSSSNDPEKDGCLGCSIPPSKTQVVGWPPIRSYRKNSLQHKKEEEAKFSGIYVKVSMDGAPYLRKIDLGGYEGYRQLLTALEEMFKLAIGEYSERDGYKGSEYAPTYQDKDGDWMLLGDVPWEMFRSSCKKLRIMKGTEGVGLTCSP